jgi:hypothetical protein
MNTKELIKLAYKADIEGDLELADFIDRELLAASNNKNIREAAPDFSKMTRGVGNFFGNIGNFLGGYGGYSGPTNTKPLRDALQSVPNRSGLGKMFGSVGKEVEFSPEQLTELGTNLKSSIFNSRSKATPEVQSIIDEIINSGKVSGAQVARPGGAAPLKGIAAINYKLDLLRQHAIQNKIINPRSGVRLDDLDSIATGQALKPGPRTVQRVNRNTKLLAGGAAAAMAAPGLYGAFGPQAPDATGSDIPNGPAMNGMPQLGPGMGGFGGGYNGPKAVSPQGNNYNPQNIGLGSVNSAADPNSFKESAGVAPEAVYSGRNEREINPAARFRSYEGMTRGESAPVYNYNNYNAGYNPGTQSAVAPIQTPVAPVQNPVGSLEPVAPQPVAPGSLPANFADALRPATPAEAAMYQEPQPPPMTPEQIQSTMSPLATVGY